jgi:CIC family chloride channel protein
MATGGALIRRPVHWGPASALRRQQLAEFSRRTRQVLLLAGATGAATGLLVAMFERLTGEALLPAVLDAPLALQAVIPGVGLVVAALLLRYGGRDASPATADEYIRAFHDSAGRLSLREVPARLAAAVATLGAGGPLGYEGPSLYGGAAVGSVLQRRASRLFGPDESKVLLVAGAAAGVAAIFKAPVTGLVFALEVPYQEDLARRMLLPAGISAASSYIVFAAVAGTDPILPVAGQPPFNLVDLGGAAAVGLLCGLLARLFIAIIRTAKALSGRGHPAVRLTVAGAVLAATIVLAHALASTDLALGPGYHALEWALAPERSVVAVVALGTLRVAGTAAVVGGGGVGGLFIPLVIQGALVGRAVGGIFETQTTTLFPVVGMAAFLGAGYRVPLAAVVFVAEFTGRPGFVVPGLIAAIVAQLVMGRASISPYQVAGRVGHLEQRLRLPLSAALDTEARTVPSDATVEEVFWQHLIGTRQHSAAVVDGDRFRGLVCAEDLTTVDRGAWATTTVAEIVRRDVPVATPSTPLRNAIRAMDAAGLDRLAVCDDDRFVGVITAAGLVQLDELLEQTKDPP